MSPTALNADPEELARFEALADRWWNPDGPMKALHEINPLRLDYIDMRAPLKGARVLDVGCGAGLLSEGMARRGARVLGIDLARPCLDVAADHAREHDIEVEYRCQSAEELAAEQPGAFEVVTCMEMLEHVPDPAQVVAACARAAHPGGAVFFSTINRNLKSFLLAIVGAEHVLGMLPKGTHEYEKLIRPSELAAWCRAAGLQVVDITGLHYNPLTRSFQLGGNVDVNYFVETQRGVTE
ncbi:MAG: bifunctional 2-polyprenyl-6-hydroxyphenol methylase/3-demethylubiquinol 3-O-methyltransferase UbiG [Rhodospirillaceae bacterium]|nr:bifunctional 2-polyprenyl-6-hydroxyphenol methylase/3-demethylubiquinol 3-O-methyltransferase UbiG [Rhodospirillaceae bacterium]MDE0363659.1 bifunctional 2-polyprenyl-6-hydroxyphenol methylase/3-demethylubiquinol 3-O-methyltransferase UbiG [Rhodospirillaceae bacterium]